MVRPPGEHIGVYALAPNGEEYVNESKLPPKSVTATSLLDHTQPLQNISLKIHHKFRSYLAHKRTDPKTQGRQK